MPRPRTRTGALLLALTGWSLALTTWSSPAHATPPDIFGYGPRTQAMGMTGTSFAADYEAVWANPAGLAASQRSGIALGLQAGSFELKLDGERFPLEAFQGSTIGFHIPLPFGGPLEDVFTIGAGFFTPSKTVLQTDIIFPETPQMVLLSRSQSVLVQMALGINLGRWIPGLRVGAGVSALANIRGRLLVQLDATNQFISQTETQLLASFNPILGVQLDIGDDWSLGLVWRDEVRSDINLRILVENLPVELPEITITAVPQFDPHTLAAEVAFHPGRHWLAALQLSWRRWSTYPGVVGKTTSNSDLPPAPDFRDTITPRLGLEYRATRRRTTGLLRMGYAYEMTPAPPARMAPGRDSEGEVRTEGGRVVYLPVRYLDSNRHVLTAGGGTLYRSPSGLVVRFDLFAQLHRVTKREHVVPAPGRTDNMISEGWIVAAGWALDLDW